MKFPSGIELVLLFTSFIIGMRFPDWDFKLKIKHRNILTHSPIILWVMIYFYNRQSNSEVFEYFIIGFSLAMGIHLLFDFFPKGWAMGALIHFPVINTSVGIRMSKMIIFFSSVYSFYLAIHYTQTIVVAYILGVLSLFTIFKNTVKEEKFFRPFITFLVVFLSLSGLKFPELKKDIYTVSSKLASQINKK